MAASPITQITDRESNDKIVAAAEASIQPTVFYVSNSALAACRTFTPKYEALAARYPAVAFTQMDFMTSTSMLFKFAPNQLPVLTLMTKEASGSMWCSTIMGANVQQLEKGIDEMLERAGIAH